MKQEDKKNQIEKKLLEEALWRTMLLTLPYQCTIFSSDSSRWGLETILCLFQQVAVWLKEVLKIFQVEIDEGVREYPNFEHTTILDKPN